MKENWKIIQDGIYSSIEKTDDDVDDSTVFATFTAAKLNLIDELKKQISDFKLAVRNLRNLKKDEVKHRREIYED
jgi:hypothetical protein